MNESYADMTSRPLAVDAGAETVGTGRRSEAVAGPFTLRDLVVGGSVLVIFVGSVLPFYTVRGFTGNLWNAVPLFFLGIGVLLPLAVAALFAARRLGRGRAIRIGSFSVDQFASIAAVLAFTYFFLQTVTDFNAGPFIALIGSVGLLAATTLGTHLAPFAGDFAGRPESAAHVTARDAVPALPRPPKPVQNHVGTQNGYSYGVAPSGVASSSDAGDFGAYGYNAHGGHDRRTDSVGGPDAVGHGVGAADMASTDLPAAAAPTPAAETVRIANDSSAQPVSVPPLSGDALSGNALSADGLTRDDEPGYTAGDYAQESDASRDAAAPTTALQPQTAVETESPAEEPVAEAFWVAVPEPRQVFDAQTGQPLFMAEPGRWLLVLQDRGDSYVVKEQDDVDPASGQQLDGTGTRIGIMYDLSNLERGE